MVSLDRVGVSDYDDVLDLALRRPLGLSAPRGFVQNYPWEDLERLRQVSPLPAVVIITFCVQAPATHQFCMSKYVYRWSLRKIRSLRILCCFFGR